MGIRQLPTPLVATTEVSPNFKFMVTTDILDDITAPGYLNQVDLQSNPVSKTDILQVLYNFNDQTQSGSFGTFSVSIANGTITLVPTVSPGDVILPVVGNNIPLFAGNTGAIYDGGFTYSNFEFHFVPTLNKVNPISANNLVAFNDSFGAITQLPDGGDYSLNGFLLLGSPTASISTGLVLYPATANGGFFALHSIANVGKFGSTIATDATLGQDSTYTLPNTGVSAPIIGCFLSSVSPGNLLKAGSLPGSIQDSGAQEANLVFTNIVNNMSSGSAIYPFKVTGTESGGALTINSQAGIMTTSSLTTIGGDEYVFTLTNSFITASSGILLTNMGGSSTGIMVTAAESLINGSVQIRVINAGTATFNGNWIISFLVI